MQVTNSEEVAKAARDAAQALVIPSDQVDLRGIFGEKIIAEFCRQY
jgi:tRNA U34 2-thiouridine synthase MnmA/TrmU